MTTTATHAEQAGRLTTDEHMRLVELEAVIDRGLVTFVEVGEALLEIKRERLHRATHRTFAAYVRERWDLGPTRADQLISTARVAHAITEHSGAPPSQASAHSLVQLAPVLHDQGPEKVAEVFAKVRAEHGERPSAVKVRQAVTDSGAKPYANQRGRRTTLPQIADALVTVRQRVDRLRGELAGKPLGTDSRVEARRLAGVARGLQRDLEELAGPTISDPHGAKGTPKPSAAAGELVDPLPEPSPFLLARDEQAPGERATA